MPKTTAFVLDAGNVNIKSNAPTGVVKEDSFPHAIVKMSESDYRRVAGRTSSADEDYIIVNDTPFGIGEKGLRHGRFDRLHGAQRYTRAYYGTFLAIALTRTLQRPSQNVFLLGSHAPKDIDYAEDLMKAAIGEWSVVWKGDKYLFKVVDAATYDEPLGGWANVTLRKDGRGYADKKVNDGVTLVLDIGGYTTDGIVIDPNGSIDYSTALSETVGVIDATRQFERDFRTQNAALVKDIAFFDEARVYEAIRTGVMNLRGKGTVHCEGLATETRNSLVAKVESFYRRYGGAANYDYIILTGGGSALLEYELRQRLGHNNVILAEDPSKMHLANVRGGSKWLAMHQILGNF